MIAARLRKIRDDDRGTTMMELVVAMTVLSAFLGMFTGAIVLMSSTVNKVQATAYTSGQVNGAFLQLDKSLRYATGISTPVRSGASNDWNVEFAALNGTSTVCTQLRVNNNKLQRRTWTIAGSSYTGLSGWAALAANVTNGSAAAGATDAPFQTPKNLGAQTGPPVVPGVAPSVQRLTVTLTVSSATSSSAITKNSMTFTALNSSTSSTTPVCQQVSVDSLT